MKTRYRSVVSRVAANVVATCTVKFTISEDVLQELRQKLIVKYNKNEMYAVTAESYLFTSATTAATRSRQLTTQPEDLRPDVRRPNIQ